VTSVWCLGVKRVMIPCEVSRTPRPVVASSQCTSSGRPPHNCPEKPRECRPAGGNAAAAVAFDRLQLALVVNDDVI